ncbi:MAG: PhzF family phenazine biosynthesis protein [Pseudomonadota bacterium]
MPSRRFVQTDVFSPVPIQGNGLAVVIDSHGLTDDDLQRFAAWTNLAETTFLYPPDDPAADYRVRIMTPSREMLFAGHPTLGSCAAWLHTGGVPKEAGVVRQECGVGIVEIDVTQARPAFVAPPTTVRPMAPETRRAIIERLEISPDAIVDTAELDNGPVWQAFHLRSADAVLALDGRRVRWPDFKALGFIGPHPDGTPHDYEVRMLAPSSGMLEDPITGSLNAALACWMQDDGRLRGEVQIAQGTTISRCGRVSIRPVADGRILVGGDVHVVIEGTVEI